MVGNAYLAVKVCNSRSLCSKDVVADVEIPVDCNLQPIIECLPKGGPSALEAEAA